MKKIGVFVFVLIMCLASVHAEWFLSYSDSYIASNITFNIIINKTSYAYRIRDIRFNTTLFPKDDFRQKVVSVIITPENNITNDFLYYEWDLPQDNKTVSINSFLHIKDVRRHIRYKVKYPFEIAPYLKKYVQPTEIFDSDNPKIRELASSFAEKNDDLFDIVFKIGAWVNKNIKYVIDNDTLRGTKKASWVLEHRKGLCDESTALFIALCRALNIPARYVGGMAYSNMTNSTWISHAWAEVYFPGNGWVPFDVVYGEFGFLDVSHIEFYDSDDANRSSTRLAYQAMNAKVLMREPKINIELKKTENKEKNKLKIDMKPFRDTIGFDSYNYIDVEVQNKMDYYIADKLSFDKSEGIVFVNPNRFILLKPNQTRHYYFIFKNNLTFTDRYYYKHIIAVRTMDGYTKKTTVTTKPYYQRFTLNTIKEILQLKKKENENSTAVLKTELECKPREFSYVNYPLDIPCYVSNRGNVKMSALRLCLTNECHGFNLEIGERKRIDFNITFNSSGQHNVIAELVGNNVTKSYFMSIFVYPEPKLEIVNLNYTKEVSYKDKVKLNFAVKNLNESPVKNVRVELKHPYLGESWKLKNFKKEWIIKVDGRAKDLVIGNNNFTIQVKYQDLFSRNFTVSRNVVIRLKDLNFIQKIPLWIRDFLKWIDHLFD